MIKLVVSDLDGTLLNEHSELTLRTRDAIRALKKRGIHFAIASGRSNVSARRFREELGIEMYLICNNGANIYDEYGNGIYKASMNPELVEKIIRFFSERDVNYNGFDEENLYIRSRIDAAIVSLENQYFDLKAIDELASYPAMTKLLAKGEEELIQRVREELLQEQFAVALDITISHPRCLDVVDRNATKGKGLRMIAQSLNVAFDEIMAFGDAENDLDMLLTAGHPVVMADSMLLGQPQFQYVAKSSRENGVAQYLEEYFDLGQQGKRK
jgi:Cof subfamily protein (haloacid dehalogenase superfamily)